MNTGPHSSQEGGRGGHAREEQSVRHTLPISTFRARWREDELAHGLHIQVDQKICHRGAPKWQVMSSEDCSGLGCEGSSRAPRPPAGMFQRMVARL